MSERKKKILWCSNYSRLKTGFGRNSKAVLKYLYSTGKYEIVEYCAGYKWSDPELKTLPWDAYGTLPDSDAELHSLSQDHARMRLAQYGEYNLDKVIAQEKPDVIFMVEDPWGILYSIDRPYYDKLNWVYWSTVDSLPILKEVVEKAPKIKNFWVWASFAEKALKKLGNEHVKTVHGCFGEENFYKLPNLEAQELRKRHGLSENDFIIGDVFRNQLRKTVYALIEGYKVFTDKNPEVSAKLLLHTSMAEGWDIPKICKENEVDTKDVLTTYIDSNGDYFILPVSKQAPVHPSNKGEQLDTIRVNKGVTEKQLNEIYNLMDVFCHCFTSGGQEIPVFEAKLCEKITLVTNYSCGEDAVCEGSGGLPLDFKFYREFGTEFLKSETYPSSVAKQLEKVYKMDSKKRRELEKISRQYVLNNYSIKSIGPEVERVVDESDFLIDCFGHKDLLDNGK